VLRIICKTVRDSQTEADVRGGYCVYDTALEHSPAHAEAFQRVLGAKEALRELRRQTLFAAVHETFVPVDAFRNGLLADLAPAA